jgi:RNA polymerase sigma factor (sigma-70 family)
MSRSLIEKFFRKRTRGAFAALVRDNSALIHRTAYRILGDQAAAEDIVQEVFLRLLRMEGVPVQSDRGFLAWQAVDLSRRHLRGEARRKAREETAMARKEERGDSGEVYSSDDRLAVQEEVERLPEDLRHAVELHYFSGQTIAATARALDISRRTVAYRLGEARERLSKRLAPRLAAILLAPAIDIRFSPSPRLRARLRVAYSSLPGLIPPVLLSLPYSTKVAIGILCLACAGGAAIGLGGGMIPWTGIFGGSGGGTPKIADRPTEGPVPGPPEKPASPAILDSKLRLHEAPAPLARLKGTVRGRLVESRSGTPIPYQQVFVSFGNPWDPARLNSVATDANGRFEAKGEGFSALGDSVRVDRAGSLPVIHHFQRWGLPDEVLDIGDIEVFPAARLRVTVLDPDKKPVEHARVTIQAPPSGGFMKLADEVGTTERRGMVSTATLRPQTAYVLASLDGYLPVCTSKPLELPPDRERVVTLRLERPRQLSVKVVDDSGQPIAGALLRPSVPFRLQDADPRLFAVDRSLESRYRTGQAGLAVLPHQDFPLKIQAYGDGLEGTSIEANPEQDDVQVVMARTGLASHASVSGIVLHDGMPVEPFQIRRMDRAPAVPVDPEPDFLDVDQDHRGHFRFFTRPGSADFRVESVEAAPTIFRLDLKPGAAQDGVRVELLPGFTVSGRVTDDSGTGVPRVRLFFRQDNLGPVAFTGEDGRFHASGFEKGKYQLEIEGELCGRILQPDPIELEGPREDLAFSIFSRTALRLRVRDRFQLPVGDLRVEFRTIGVIPRSKELLLPSVHGDHDWSGLQDGSIIDLLPGVSFSIQVKGHGVKYVARIPPLAKGEIRTVEIAAQEKVVRGLLTHPDGRPAKGVFVGLRYLDPLEEQESLKGGGDWRNGQDRTDIDGGFSIAAPVDGRVEVGAHSESQGGASTEISIQGNDPIPPVVLVLGGTRAVQGTVTGDDGKHLPGATVRCGSQETLSGADGQFSFQVGIDEEVQISAEKLGWISSHSDLRARPGDREIHLTLERGAIIRVRVLDIPDQETFLTTALLGRFSTSVAKVDGALVEFEAALPGSYRLFLATRGSGACMTAVDVAAGDVREVEARLTPPSSIRGVVRANGRPLEGAAVTASLASLGKWPDIEDSFSLLSEAKSGEDGHFELNSGDLFPQKLSVKARGSSTWDRVLEKSGDARGDLIVDLAPASRIRGLVKRRGEPVPDVQVSLNRLDSERVTVRTGADGRFELEVGPEKNGGLLVNFPGGSLQVPIDGRGDDGKEIIIDLAEGSIVRGRISGALLGDRSWSSFRPPLGGTIATANIGSDGSYEVRGLAPGRHAVQWMIELADGSQVIGTEEIELPTGELRHDVEIPAGRIAGVVRGPDGAGLSGAQVSAGGEAAGWHAWARSGVGGKFTLSGLEPGRYDLVALKDDIGRGLLAGVEAGSGEREPVEVLIQQGISAKVRIEGSPSPWGCILEDLRGEVLEMKQLEDGRIDFGKVASGRYRLMVLGQEKQAGQPSIPLSLDVEFGPDKAPAVTLRPGGEVQVRVIDAAGRPVTGATVRVGREVSGGTVKADGEGRVYFRCPFAGSYEISASLGDVKALRAIEVSGGDQEVEIRLEETR